MFSALVPVRVDLPFDLAAADLPAVTVSESFLLPPMSVKKGNMSWFENVIRNALRKQSNSGLTKG